MTKITEYGTERINSLKTDLIDVSVNVDTTPETQKMTLDTVKRIEGLNYSFNSAVTFDMSYNRVVRMPVTGDCTIEITGLKNNGFYYIHLSNNSSYNKVSIGASLGSILTNKESLTDLEPDGEAVILITVQPTGTVYHHRINPVIHDKKYELEWIEPTAYPSNETWNPATEINDGVLDYAIMPKFVQNTKTGTLFHYFAVASGHNVFTNRVIVFRKSIDGGKNWTALDGTAGSYTVMDFFNDGGTQVDNAGCGCTEDGRIILFVRRWVGGVYEGNYMTYSDDDSVTWSTPSYQGYFSSYAFDNKFVYGMKGELIMSRGEGSGGAGERKLCLYDSFDKGVTWLKRSTVYDPQRVGYTFGEPMMRDFGNGLFVIICRNANGTAQSGTFSGMDLPMLFVSRDYGRTWADGVETITQAQFEAGEFNSGHLPLEGKTVDLGDGTYENCLPHFENIEYKGHSYMLIVYYLRDEIDLGVVRDELLRMTAIKTDEWLAKGWRAIKEDVAVTVFEANNSASSPQYDGNGMIFFPKNRPEGFWTIGDNLSSSETGNEVITSGRITRATVEALLDSIETATSIS